MINSEYKRRQHLSKEVNAIVASMAAISKLPDEDTVWINDKLSYFKRNMLDMAFHKIDTDNQLYTVSNFAYELYNLAEKYEITKKIKLPTEKFDKFLSLLKVNMDISFKNQYHLDDMEKYRVQTTSFDKGY